MPKYLSNTPRRSWMDPTLISTSTSWTCSKRICQPSDLTSKPSRSSSVKRLFIWRFDLISTRTLFCVPTTELTRIGTQVNPALGQIISTFTYLYDVVIWRFFLVFQRVAELDEITQIRDRARKRHDDLRKTRLNEFMEGFGIITGKLKEMYQVNIYIIFLYKRQ